jgi:dTDP-glucose pyrophosphorylase
MTPEADDYRKLVLPASASVRQAIKVMTVCGNNIVLVAGKDRKLKGIVVDSDIRKGILRGHDLEAPLSKVMNASPATLPSTMNREALMRFFTATPRANMPLVDAKGRICGLAQMSRYLTQKRERPNWVVLLVGGAGERLRPLTEKQPKPLLLVGDKPLLETIIEQFLAAGLSRFVLAVNHHADQIRAHFGDGSRLNADIRYVQETKRLGTAGPLSLLPAGYKDPLIVMNGDLLTKIDLKSLLDFHSEEKNLATVCVREYDYQVPFGVIEMKDHRLTRIIEKPTHRFFVSAGIYVVEPKILKWVPRDKYFGMPDLLELVRRRKPGSIGCFPIREYWIDIGQMKDFERAQVDYPKFF